MTNSNLCSVDELNQHLGSSGLSVVDASWFLPAAKVDCRAEFHRNRIPGSVFFDIDQVCDQGSSLPHMLPIADQFSAEVSKLGILNTDRIVVYDSAGLFSAARVWWMFKLFGHENVQVLDGGLPAWRAAGCDLATTKSVASKAVDVHFFASLNETFLVTKDVLINNGRTGKYIVLDARSNARFTGEQPEPRPGLPSGHMPQSVSLPFDQLLINGKLKPKSQLKNVFAAFNLKPESDSQAIVTSCGSGVTAAIITLALSEAGFSMHKLYDGAWAEWASASDTDILLGS